MEKGQLFGHHRALLEGVLNEVKTPQKFLEFADRFGGSSRMSDAEAFACLDKVHRANARLFWTGWIFGTVGMGVVAFVLLHLRVACP